MRPVDGGGVAAVLDVPHDGAAAASDARAPRRGAVPRPHTYSILLLAGEPRRCTAVLPAGIEAGMDIDVEGDRWTVADVRTGRDGAATTLVCIYAA